MVLPGKKTSKNLQQLTREKEDSQVRHFKMLGMYYGADITKTWNIFFQHLNQG